METWADFAPLWGFLLAQKGRAESFTYTLPVSIAPARGTWSGTPVIDGGSQTGDSIDLDGFTLSDTGVAKAGDLIRFANHAKVYIVTADADADGAGAATVAIQPALMASPGDGSAVTVHKAAAGIGLQVALALDDLELALPHCVRYGLDVSLIEVP